MSGWGLFNLFLFRHSDGKKNKTKQNKKTAQKEGLVNLAGRCKRGKVKMLGARFLFIVCFKILGGSKFCHSLEIILVQNAKGKMDFSTQKMVGI